MERLRDVGEFGLIQRLQEVFGSGPANGVEIGIGDDAAVLSPTPGSRLVVTTDALVENIHFVLNKIDPHALGRRAMASNMSDIAAMGARPRHAFLVLGLREDANIEFVIEMARGMAELAADFSTRIVGGDIVRSPSALMLAITVLGEAANGVLTRSGAKIGDLIMVTGDLGGSAAGLGAMMNPSVEAQLTQAVRDTVMARHQNPVPRVCEGLALSQRRLATAALDVSDGLAGDLRHICEQSSVGACIDPLAIPIHDATRIVAGWLGRDPIALALTGGEDFELLFTCKPEDADEIRHALHPTPVTQLGEIVEGSDITLSGIEADRYARYLHSFDHFR